MRELNVNEIEKVNGGFLFLAWAMLANSGRDGEWLYNDGYFRTSNKM